MKPWKYLSITVAYRVQNWKNLFKEHMTVKKEDIEVLKAMNSSCIWKKKKAMYQQMQLCKWTKHT